MKNKAVFFDRDKTIILPNQDNYIYKVGDFYIPREFVNALRKLNDNGFMLFVVTNQGRVAKGFLSEDDVKNVHSYLMNYFSQLGVEFSEFVYCPHNPDGSVAPYNIECDCRKPEPGMIQNLISKHKIDTSNSWMVGDSRKDIVAGNFAGLRTILVQTGYFQTYESADYVEKNIEYAVERILKQK